MLGREGEREAARRLPGEPGFGFLGDMRRMIVEDHLDRRVGRIGRVEQLEELDEFSTAMTISDQGVNLGLSGILCAGP